MADSASRILATLAAASDRSSGSDELRAAAPPGWDEYHLTGAGANVMRPVGIRPGERVLVLGAGSGVLVRHAADAGAEVVGVEADPRWLDVARMRVEGCATVELRHRPPGTDAEPFDVVILAACPESSPLPALQALLDGAASRLAPNGVVALAVPNAVSVAQLAGFRVPDLPGVSVGMGRTDLLSAFGDAGLSVGACMACYPDVFTTTVMLTDAAFDAEDAVALVDQLVGAPVSGLLGRPLVLSDDRAVLQALVAEGAGPATAPGLLVIAGGNVDAVTSRLGEGAVAWRFTGGRRRALQQQLEVRATPSGRFAYRRLLHEAEPLQFGWLTHSLAPQQPYMTGRTLEQEALEAMASGDPEAVRGVLQGWANELRSVVGPRPDITEHPFLPAGAERVLPHDYLDVGLDNFSAGPDGFVFIDREWSVEGGVDFELAATRAIWKIALNTVRNGSRHPWSSDATVGGIWAELAALADLELDDEALASWRVAEGQLLAAVTGADPAATVSELESIATRSRVERARYPAGVETSAAVRDLDQQVSRLTDQLHAANRQVADLQQANTAMGERLAELRSMLPVRAARWLKRLLGR